ncbi:MAG: hypothetical protein NC248_11590 [Bacteroides sp.]|nr:hypothetical protein [Bacteroides sp.]MCM1391058.1 hypothetical protein [Bacteroides sp.]
MKETQNNRRGFIFVFAILFLIIAVSVANARVERNYKNTAAEHINLVIDSIDFRSDLTRVYARMIGMPHTSQKIERVEMRVPAGRFEATDIDGVDFKRWFQWEEDGVVAVEIDFKAMEPVKSGSLIVETARGVDTSNFSK